MIQGSGSEYVLLTNGSGSRRPKNIRILRIRICNTGKREVLVLRPGYFFFPFLNLFFSTKIFNDAWKYAKEQIFFIRLFFLFIKLNPKAEFWQQTKVYSYLFCCCCKCRYSNLASRRTNNLFTSETFSLASFMSSLMQSTTSLLTFLYKHGSKLSGSCVPVIELSDSGSGFSAATARLRNPFPNLPS